MYYLLFILNILSLAFFHLKDILQHFKFVKLVNWRIRGFVFWCHKQVWIVPEHVSFKKKVKYSAVILVTPNQDFSNGPQSFHQQTFVWLCNRLILVQDWVQVLQMFQGVGIFGLPNASKESSIFKHFFLQKSYATVTTWWNSL